MQEDALSWASSLVHRLPESPPRLSSDLSARLASDLSPRLSSDLSARLSSRTFLPDSPTGVCILSFFGFVKQFLQVAQPAAALAVAIVLVPVPAHNALAQSRPTADSTRRDSLARLPEVRITVTTRNEALQRVPWSVGVANERDLRVAQPTTAFGEALGSIPGVYVAERYNYAVDSRISVRGFGSRANFGVRGVRILLDGIPQTLPDGQSQISNIELGAIDRVEVLRGSASSLYGNGSGGVLSFETDMGGAEPRGSIRVTGGSFGMLKLQGVASGMRGPAAGMISVSRLTTDGSRQYSAAEVRQVNGGVDWAFGPQTTLALRMHLTQMPEATNPGALTVAEYNANADSASATNMLRGADKRISQYQLGAVFRHTTAAGGELTASVYGVTRDVRNALGVQPPPPVQPSNGTYNTLDRNAGGARVSFSQPLGSGSSSPLLTAGVEWARMQDVRENWRATGGRPVAPDDTPLLFQVEDVTSLGPFAQLAWSPHSRVHTTWGVRWDRTSFGVDDRFLQDGDESGSRSMPAWSGHGAVSVALSDKFVPWVNVSTAFETPTTTELQVSTDGGGGFNRDLDPQRTLSVEAGARGSLADDRVAYSASLFRNHVSNMLVQFLETGGRAYFINAGGANNAGLEAELDYRLGDGVVLTGAWTWSHYRYSDYRLTRGASVDTLDGNVLPGVPEHQARIGLRSNLPGNVTLDLDHMFSSSLMANDANSIEVDGWGAGVTNVRASWEGSHGGVRLAPFGGVQNVWNRRYISAVTVNGFGGRVLEPAPGRNFYLGMEVGF